MNFSSSLLNLFKLDKKSTAISTGFTNAKLVAGITDHFKEQLELLSVGQRMIYPMSFYVLLHEDDYTQVKESFPLVVPEIFNSLYRVIKAESTSFPNYTPPATSWFLQFTSCKDTVTAGNQKIEIEKGKIQTIAHVFSKNLSKETNLRVSLRLADSDVSKYLNVNKENFTGFTMSGEGSFTHEFDPELEFKAKGVELKSSGGYAKLKFTQGHKDFEYTMQDELITISGNKESRKGRAYLILDNPDILAPHIQIRYDSTKKAFFIAAFGEVRLNDRLLTVSKKYLEWYSLANHSQILINSEFAINFQY